MRRLAAITLISVLPLAATVIDVTNETFAPVHTGALVTIEFGVWNYALHSPSDPYPTTLGLQIVGLAPDVAPATLAGSSTQVYPGYAFHGYLQSLDGSTSVPLDDPLAELAGLGEGMVVVAPGEYRAGGDSQVVGVLHASVYLSPEIAQALFGPSFTAVFVLQNRGPGFVVGIGPGYVVRNAIGEPGVAGPGAGRVSGITGTVTVSNPEPGTWVMMAGAAALLLAWRRRARLHPRGDFR
jgi:MYXO-CTERM domain-containing protein